MTGRIISRRGLVAVIPAFALPVPAGAESPPSREAAIRQLLDHTFGRPDARLSLDPLVIQGDAAVVGWMQGDMAGRALLRETGGQWTIIACAGNALRSAGTLQRLGVPADQGVRLSARLADAEARLDPAHIARLDSFNGITEMGGGGHPPPSARP
jgi:hypothetical protein